MKIVHFKTCFSIIPIITRPIINLSTQMTTSPHSTQNYLFYGSNPDNLSMRQLFWKSESNTLKNFQKKKIFFIPSYLGPFNQEVSQTYMHRLSMNCIVTGWRGSGPYWNQTPCIRNPHFPRELCFLSQYRYCRAFLFNCMSMWWS